MSSAYKKKYLILVPDGMADAPEGDLENGTPLAAARTPWMDKMASAGDIGLVRTIPEGIDPGSDVANLSILGYSPGEVYTGRAPFEAASMGIGLGQDDLAFRLNLVTLDRNYTIMADHSADHISSSEAREIIASLAPMIESLGLQLVAGISYRNLMVWGNGPEGCVTNAPHDFPGRPIDERLPSGPGADVLLRIIIKSWKILESHPVNLRRVKRHQGAANSVWPWGQGKPPRIKTFKERFDITGSVVAAVDLVRGIGSYAGLESVDVPGATGYLDTNYEGKAEAALAALKEKDFVYLHVEAPDEAGHSGQRDLKIKAIEDFDERIVGPILAGLKAFDQWRILLMPDHQTPVATRLHSSAPVPFILIDSRQWNASDKSQASGFSETAAMETGVYIDDATRMVKALLEKESL
ncbi:MAG: cofactor-independent phosphoglycerate mutase [Pseudomonadota bacterium]